MKSAVLRAFRLLVLTLLTGLSPWAFGAIFQLNDPSQVSAALNVPFLFAPQTNGLGTPPIVFSMTGTLPAGLSFNSTIGKIVGTPTATATANVTIAATDSSSTPKTATQPLEIDVTNIAYTGSNNVTFISGGPAFNYRLTAAGGTPPYSYVISNGTLPTGLSLSPSGLLGSATNAATGIVPVTVTITDSTPVTPNTTTAVINVGAQAFGMPSPQVATGAVGAPFNFTLAPPFGGVAPVMVSGTSFIPGVNFNAGTLTFSGTPTSGGTFNVFLNTVDSNNDFAPTTAVTVTIPPTPLVLTASAGTTTVAAGFNAFLGASASGGVTPYVYTLSAGTLPNGFTFNPNSTGSQISGSSTALGSYPITLKATDSVGSTATVQIPLVIAKMAISSSPMATAESGVFFSYSTFVNGATGGVTYMASGLPAGLTINSNGQIRGIPTSGSSSPVTSPVMITATDSTSATATLTLQLTVAPVAVTSPNTFTAIVGTPYSYQLTAAGGITPYTFALANGTTLPLGITMTSGGLIAGTATAQGPSSPFTIQVTDSTSTTPLTNQFAATFQVNSFGFPSPLVVNGTLGTGLSYTLPVAGGTPPYFFSGSSSPAPGLTFNSTTGVISGIPTSPGTFAPGFNASDSNSNNAGTQSFTIVVPALPITVTQSFTAANLVTNSSYSNSLTVTGGVAPYSYAVTSGALPAGITINQSGQISGTAVAAGSTSATVTVTDNLGSTVTTVVPLTVASFGITGGNPPVGAAGVPYEQQFSTSGFTGTVTFSATGLPAGVTMLSNGILTGTFATPNAYFPVVTASDSSGHTVTNTYTLVMQPFIGTSTSSFSLVVGSPFSYQLTEAGSAGPFTYAVSSGSTLPSGLTLSSSGLLSGTLASAVNTFVNYTITDGSSTKISGPGLSISTKAFGIATPASTPLAIMGTPYSYTLQAAGGTGPYTYTATSNLPSGLTLNSHTGVISGTPTQGARSFNVNVTATDSSTTPVTSPVASVSFAIQPGALAVTNSNLETTGLINSNYSGSVTITGGYSPYLTVLTSGSLPTGVTLSGTSFSGTLTTLGSYSGVITVTDSAGTAVTLSIPLTVANFGISTNSSQTGAAGVPFALNLFTTGMTSPLTWSVTGLPPGLTMNALNGLVSGTPTMLGTYAPVFTVTDSSSTPKTASNPLLFTIQALTTGNAPTLLAIDGTAYSDQLPVAGGTGPYTFALTSITTPLPTGLTLSSSGVLSGTTTTPTTGTNTYTYTVSDNLGDTAFGTFFLGARAFGLAAPLSPPVGTAGSPYSYTLAATGGTAPYTYSVSSLPSGLSLNSATGVIGGTPTLGSHGFNVTVGATDSSSTPLTATGVTLTLVIAPQPLVITSPSAVSGLLNSSFSYSIATTGGSGSNIFTLSGSLPPGLSLSSSGTISGTPTASGTFPVTITVTDGASATAALNLTITTSTFGFNSGSFSTSAAVGVPVSLIENTVGATGTVSFAATGLPPGLSVAGNGNGNGALVSGSPTATGVYVATITATDSSNPAKTTLQIETITVRAVVFTGTTNFIAVAGVPYSYQLTAAGGTSPYSFALTSGTLPAGLTVNGGGLISGTATSTASSSTNVTFTVTDHVGNTATLGTSFLNRPFGFNSPEVAGGTAGTALSFQPAVGGGTPPYSLSATGLPSGLSLNPATGQIAGTTTQGGSFTVNLLSADSSSPALNGASASLALNLTPLPLTATFGGAATQLVNTPYGSVSLNVNGGIGPYSYAITSGSLPTGITLSSGGTISGTPTVNGVYSARIAVTDKAGSTANVTVPIAVSSFGFSFGAINPVYVLGSGISFNDSATGGTGTVMYAATNLPPGLTYNPFSGVFSGIPTAVGSFTTTLTATDATGTNVSTVFHISVVPLEISTSFTAVAIVGVPYSYQLEILGGTAPYVFTVPNGTVLPAGLTFSASGQLSGTATAAKSPVSVPVTVTDSRGLTIAQNITISAAAFGLASPQLVSGTYGTALSATPSGAGGTAPYNFTTTAILPSGLSLNSSSGVIGGTPTTAGTFNVSITVTDNTGLTSSATIRFELAGTSPVISVQPSPVTVIAGSSATFSVTASGPGNLLYYWYKNSIPLAIAGPSLTLPVVPLGSGGAITVTVTSAYGTTTSSPAMLTVNPIAPVLPSTGSASGIVGNTLTFTPTLNGTTATFTISPSLPDGLTLNSATGAISGTATAVLAATQFTLTATNATSTSSETLTLTVANPVPSIRTSSVTAQVGQSLSAQISATNSPTNFSATGLPPGLTIDASGLVTGTPTTPGSYTVMVTATDDTGSATAPVTFSVAAAPSAPVYSGPPAINGTQGSAFAFTPHLTGNVTGFALAASSDALPAGLTLDPTTGAISGTAVASGRYAVTLAATGGGGTTLIPLNIVINVSAAAPVINSASTVTANAGAFSFQLTAVNSPTQFLATHLPSWASLDPTSGVISGTATVGTTTVGVAALNVSGFGPTGALIIQINPAPTTPIMTSPSSYTVQVGTPFSGTLTASGTPTSFAITSGTLPDGLSLSGATLSGTPTPAAVGGTVGIAATNLAGQGLALLVNFVVQPSLTAPVVTSSGSANGQVGQPFSYRIAATNTPTAFALTGTLPAGLTLDTITGLISGVPTAATTSPAIVIVAANSAQGSGSKSLALTIAPPAAAPTVTSATTASGQVGTAFSYQITGTSSATFFVATPLPAGLAVNPGTGIVSGTPTTAGNYAINLQAGNSGGAGVATVLSLVIGAAPSAPAITSAPTATGTAGTAFTYQITATSSQSITGYGQTGTLPTGLSINTSTGAISGSPVAPGTSTIEVTATSSVGTSLPQSVAITIGANTNAPVVTSAQTAAGKVGLAFSFTLTASGLDAAPFPPAETLDAVGLPPGLGVNPSTGVISGTPTQSGTYTVAVVGQNTSGEGPAATLIIAISPPDSAPVISSGTSVSAQAGTAFSYQIAASNSPTSFDAVGGPAWLAVSTTSGALSGTPTAPGTYTVNLTASNSVPGQSVPLVITVAPAANTPVITSNPSASGTLSTAITAYQITALPAATSYSASNLPPGLSLDPATGIISGAPSASGTFTVPLVGTNANGQGATFNLTLTIQGNLSL